MAIVLDDREFDAVVYAAEIVMEQRLHEKKLLKRHGEQPGKSICKYYSKGGCSRGLDCPFRHGKPEKTVICKHWLRGLCKKNDLCEFLHIYDMDKMPLCHFIASYQECLNEECLFRHDRSEMEIRDCPWYKRGFCKHGSKCRNRHVRNEACIDYLAGFCLKGPKCKFGHPKFERPTENGWIAPMICPRCGNIGHRSNNCHAEIIGANPPPQI